MEWYQGKVILDIFPNEEGSLDLNILQSNVLEYKKAGISGLHLKQLLTQKFPTSKHIEKMKELFGKNKILIIHNDNSMEFPVKKINSNKLTLS